MKNLLTSLLVLGMVTTGFAQTGQSAADKEFLAGITLGGAMNFNSPQTKTMESKIGGDFMVGMMLDWNFSRNVALTGGLEFEFDNFRTMYNIEDVDRVYYNYDDRQILRTGDDLTSTTERFRLNERKHSSIYLTLPVMLKFQTNYLGYFRYFGRFGVRNSFLLMNRANDSGEIVDAKWDAVDGATTMDKMHSKSLMSFYRGSVGLTAGAEYNVTGSTTIVAELGYFYGFSEMFRQSDKRRSLYNVTDITISDEGDVSQKIEYYAPKLKQGLLMLKVSVLF